MSIGWRLGFIDFGNLRRFNEEEWQYHMDVATAREGSHEDHVEICKRSLMMTDEDARKHPGMLEAVIEGFAIYNEPLLFEGEFDYGNPDYIRRLLEWMRRASQQKWVKQEPMNAFSHRRNFQIPALLRPRCDHFVGQASSCFQPVSQAQPGYCGHK